MKFDRYTIAYYLIVVLAMMWLFYIPKARVVGAYINNNTIPMPEGPVPIEAYVDTLVLHENGTFSSRTWGEGTYELEGFLLSPTIKLQYLYSLGKASNSMTITKPLFAPLRIWLDHDLGFYFEKI